MEMYHITEATYLSNNFSVIWISFLAFLKKCEVSPCGLRSNNISKSFMVCGEMPCRCVAGWNFTFARFIKVADQNCLFYCHPLKFTKFYYAQYYPTGPCTGTILALDSRHYNKNEEVILLLVNTKVYVRHQNHNAFQIEENNYILYHTSNNFWCWFEHVKCLHFIQHSTVYVV